MPTSWTKVLICWLVWAASARVSFAQDVHRDPGEKLLVRSKSLGETRTVTVVAPRDGAAHPILVLLDGQDISQFSAAVSNVAFLANAGEIPSLVIVGVPVGKDRTHEFTPRARGREARSYPTAGGASETARFIEHDVLPAVRAKFRTLPGVIIAGHSFGGLFALHVAATRSASYVGVIAMSPSLWWNENASGTAYADSIARVTTPLRLVVTTGGLERDADLAVNDFAARLQTKKPVKLAFTRLRYPNDRHEVTPLVSLIDGLRFIFEPISLNRAPVLGIRKADSATFANAFVATQTAYARGAHELGLPEPLPEGFVNTLGYAVLRELRLPRVAAWVFRQNAANYPQSANVYDSLGDALLAAGDRRGARAQFQLAIDVANRNKVPVDSATRGKLKALDRELRRPLPLR